MATRASCLTLMAPAKVNLYLGVGGVRADGYHEVETVLQSVTLADTVTLESADALSVECAPDVGLPPEQNLAYRAALSLGEALGRSPAARIVIDKRIPAGGGLGGASSDAAAVLVGLTRMWGLADRGDTVRPVLHEVAASLGADVPFFLDGGTALFSGRGDVPVRRLPTPHLDIVLVKPFEPVPTAAAYAAFDSAPVLDVPGARAIIESCGSGLPAKVGGALYNNMTSAAVSIVPEIGEVYSWCAESDDVLGVALAGSGSTVFAVCRDSGAACRRAQKAIERGWWAEAVRTCAHGAAFLDSGESI